MATQKKLRDIIDTHLFSLLLHDRQKPAVISTSSAIIKLLIDDIDEYLLELAWFGKLANANISVNTFLYKDLMGYMYRKGWKPNLTDMKQIVNISKSKNYRLFLEILLDSKCTVLTDNIWLFSSHKLAFWYVPFVYREGLCGKLNLLINRQDGSSIKVGNMIDNEWQVSEITALSDSVFMFDLSFYHA